MWILNFFSSAKVRETQTHFAIRQITELLDQIDDADFPRTSADLINRLRSSRIDWNSCGIQAEQVLDGWSNPITTTFDKKDGSWSFHSFGKDARFQTALVAQPSRGRKRRQAINVGCGGDYCGIFSNLRQLHLLFAFSIHSARGKQSQ